jgi:hypothetical protein
MEKKYRTRDGDEIVATSLLDLVQQMNESSRFGKHPLVTSFMIGFAKRELEYSGKQVSTWSAANFVADLLLIGYLTVID